MYKKSIIFYGISFLFFFLMVASVSAYDTVVVDFYYSDTCGGCRPAIEVVDAIIGYYESNNTSHLVINKKEVGANATNRMEMRSRNLSYPSVIINNETRIPKTNITLSTLQELIDAYLLNVTVPTSFDTDSIDIPFVGQVNLSQLSLPVLAIVLGGLDSFNPCSFFILIFLMNILLYAGSRKRMAFIGSIFIFFSGFFYFIFMFILYNTLLVSSLQVLVISVIAGVIAVLIGFLNIKEFFFFKQGGPSLTVTDEQRGKIFRRMRQLVKSTYLPSLFAGTIFLAITVNFYELLCTLGFPLVFTTTLATYQITGSDYFLYLLLYNIVYVLPLIIIFCVFLVTLGRQKLTEWQGRKLKLLSGIMILSFGVIFIIDYQLLQQLLTPILLLISSILLTLGITTMYQKHRVKSENVQSPLPVENQGKNES